MATYGGAPTIVTDGLVFAVDAANYKSYISGSNTWYDMTGGNDGTLTSGPIFDEVDTDSILFDGSDDFIAVANSNNLDFSTHQTIFMVLKPEESDGNRRNPYAQAYGGYGTITHEPGGTFNYYHGTHGGNGSPYQGAASSFSVAENETAMITLTRDPNYVTWYKNGSLIRQQANNYSPATNNNMPIYLGKGYVSPFLGKIFLTFLYNKALSSTEILQNYNALKSRFGL